MKFFQQIYPKLTDLVTLSSFFFSPRRNQSRFSSRTAAPPLSLFERESESVVVSRSSIDGSGSERNKEERRITLFVRVDHSRRRRIPSKRICVVLRVSGVCLSVPPSAINFPYLYNNYRPTKGALNHADFRLAGWRWLPQISSLAGHNSYNK